MRKKLALFCAMTMLITNCFSVSMVNAETTNSSIDTPLVTEYGKLVAYQNFEQGNDTAMAYVDTDYMDNATMVDWMAGDMVRGTVLNPDQTIGGNVLNATHKEGRDIAYYAIDFNGSKMYDGKYQVVFDYYSKAKKTDFGLGWFGWAEMRAFPSVESNSTWSTVIYPEFTATTDYSSNQYGDTTFMNNWATKVVNGTAEAPNPQVPSFGFHYDHSGESDTAEEPSYIDNIRVYYFPENSYMLADENGNPAEIVEFDETAATVTLPAKDGVSAWTFDGKNFYPAGYAMPTSEILGKYLILKPFEVSTYDDTKGELLLYYDYDIEGAGINTPTYINKVYFDTISNSYVNYPNVDMTKTGVYETDASGNMALKQYTAGNSSYGFIRTDTPMRDGLSFPQSTYNVDFKFYAFKDGFDYSFKDSHLTGGKVWFNNGGGSVEYTFPEGTDYDMWVPVNVTKTIAPAMLESWGFEMGTPSLNHDTATYYDDVAIYCFPSTKMHFKASKESSIVKEKTADANGQIVVPTKQELGLDIDGRVTAWKAADGTTLTVGETVDTATFAAKTYYPVVVNTTATFTFGDAQAAVDMGEVENFTLPTAEAINAEWTGNFYGWLYDGKLYKAGEAINVAEFIGKTFTAVRSELSIPPAELSELGKLVVYQNFEQDSHTAMAYVDTEYLDNAQLVDWLAGAGMVCGTVPNPDEIVGGNVFNATHKEDQSLVAYNVDFIGSKMYDGKYSIAFDYYSDAKKTDFGLGWFGYTELRAFPQIESNSTWETVTYPSLTVTTDYSNNPYGDTIFENTTGSIVRNGTVEAPNPQVPSFGFHHEHKGEGDTFTEPTYFDNLRVYYFPENSYIIAGANGELQELVEFDEKSATVTLPEIDGVYAWMANGEYLCEAGESVATSELLGKYLTLKPLTKPIYDEELGNLVFNFDFENLELGNYNDKFLTPSYVNGAYTGGFADFTLRTFGENQNSVIDINGNNVFELRGTGYPQIQLWGKDYYLDLQHEGIYTITADATVIDSNASGFAIQPQSDNGIEKQDGTSGINGSFTTTQAQIEISAATAREALTNCLIFFGTSEEKYVLLDNISMYAKTNKYHIVIDEDTRVDGFFAPGMKITLPEVNTFVDSIPEGYELSHYDINGEKYYPGDEYMTSSDDAELNITAVVNKIDYYASFNLGTINGTLTEIPVNLGGSITLPTVEDESFIGWRLYGSKETLNAGSIFTLNSDSIVDEYNRFVFEAVTNSDEMIELKSMHELSSDIFIDATEEELEYISISYGTGVIPKADTFARDASVTVGDLIGYAVKLYNKANGINVDFATVNALAEYAVSKGICTEYADYNAASTFADLADIFANILPDGYYRDTYNNVITDDSGINENAKKLINVGIIEKDTVMSDNITYKDAVYAMARTIQKSLRLYNDTKTLYILGDSLCEGVAGYPGWVDKISEFVGDRINVVNYGIGGINTGSYLVTWDCRPQQYYKEYLAAVKPGDYVMIALGTNDATLWSGTVENQYMSYEESLANYKKLAEDAYFNGAQPFFVVPAGWNLTDEDGNYYPYNVEEAKLILDCMQDVNDIYGLDVPIINFKDISVERFAAMTEEERAKIYADPVHYTDYGSSVVCGIFDELIRANEDAKLRTLRNCFTKDTLDLSSLEELTITDYSNKKATIVAPKEYQNVTLLFAVYNNDKLMDCKFINNLTITEGTSYCEVNVDTKDATAIRVFIWDNLKDQEPLCDKNETIIIK